MRSVCLLICLFAFADVITSSHTWRGKRGSDDVVSRVEREEEEESALPHTNRHNRVIKNTLANEIPVINHRGRENSSVINGINVQGGVRIPSYPHEDIEPTPPEDENAVVQIIQDDQEEADEENSTSVDYADEYTRCMETVLLRQPSVGPPVRDGMPGIPGRHGLPGIPGLPGRKGEPGRVEACTDNTPQNEDIYVPNIRHCAWNNYNFALSIGKVQSCSFTKKQRSSILRVEWHGATRVKCSQPGPCCNRWYFSFDGSECTDPQPIDGVIYMDSGNASINNHRTMSVVGMCRGISEGIHDIAFWVGECNGGYSRGMVRTGWNSSSRIIIDELPYQ